MRADQLAPYEHSLRDREPLAVVDVRGRLLHWDTARWLGRVDAADRSVLDRCSGPALDLGCGPGRIAAALAERGVPTLGVDVAPTAVGLTRERGVAALQRDLFGPLPGEGRWQTVLLLDGNLGIGGDVGRLLTRAGALLAPGGALIVEVEDEQCDEVLHVRFHRAGGAVGDTFAWARFGSGAVRSRAAASGLRVAHTWQYDGRHFVELRST